MTRYEVDFENLMSVCEFIIDLSNSAFHMGLVWCVLKGTEELLKKERKKGNNKVVNN